MSNDPHYLQQVAQVRAQKQREELAAERNQAVYGYQESLANRKEIERQSALTTDPNERAALKDEWHYYDAEVQRCEQQIRELSPPPQADPRMVEFTRRISPWIEKHGAAGLQRLGILHNYATRPRHPHADPSKVGAGSHGAGLRPGTRAYFNFMRSGMELYGAGEGMPYDQGMDLPNWKEAARASGLSEKTYIDAYRQLKAQGRVR
jgi:hypothetical protein